MDYTKLVTSLREAFIEQDAYFFDKHVPEFVKDGVFLGDYFNTIAVEPLGSKPPRFYHVYSPFDVISNKAPTYASVFENGELLLHMDFEEQIVMRTAAMNLVLLKGLGIESLASKNVLLFGSGKIATQTVQMLALELGLKTVDVMSKSGDLNKIKTATEKSGVAIQSGSIERFSEYDVIICHTQSTEPVIRKEDLVKIKQGAILASFISSTNHGEFPDEIFDSAKANIITDWSQTILGAKDLQRARDNRLFAEGDLLYMKDILTGKRIDESKQYTVYRSTGTPIQNLAALKLLI